MDSISVVRLVASTGCALIVAACGARASQPAQTPTAGAEASLAGNASATSTTASAGARKAQIDSGAQIYKDRCASCHGGKGQGDAETPAVAGASSLPLAPPAGAKMRKGEFKNAEDVTQFVKKAMPIDEPGSLSLDQSYAVVAWELSLTGSSLGAKPLDASDASSILVHPR